jgi:hypothetical protein
MKTNAGVGASDDGDLARLRGNIRGIPMFFHTYSPLYTGATHDGMARPSSNYTGGGKAAKAETA